MRCNPRTLAQAVENRARLSPGEPHWWDLSLELLGDHLATHEAASEQSHEKELDPRAEAIIPDFSGIMRGAQIPLSDFPLKPT